MTKYRYKNKRNISLAPITISSPKSTDAGIDSRVSRRGLPKGKHQRDLHFNKYIAAMRLCPFDSQKNKILGDGGYFYMGLREETGLAGILAHVDLDKHTNSNFFDRVPIAEKAERRRSMLRKLNEQLTDLEMQAIDAIVINSMSSTTAGIVMGFPKREASRGSLHELRSALKKIARQIGILTSP